MMKPRISMITLGVENLQKSLAFYQTGLGFPLEEATDDVAFFSLNGSWLGLYSKTALAQDAQVPEQGQGFPGFALAHNVSVELEVDTLLKQAVAAGARLTKPGQTTSWGGYSGYFADLDGYLWEIAYNPFAWIGPEDH